MDASLRCARTHKTRVLGADRRLEVSMRDVSNSRGAQDEEARGAVGAGLPERWVPERWEEEV